MRRLLLLPLLIAMLAIPAQAFGRSPVVWKVEVLRYLTTNSVCDNGSILFPVSGRLDVATSDRMISEFVQNVNTWSEGAAVVEVTVVDRPVLRSLSANGAGCWPDPWDTLPDPGFDSVIVLWDHDLDAAGEVLCTSTAGLAYTDFFPSGMTYGTVVVPDGNQWWQATGMVLVHEWMNGMLGWYRQTYGKRIPSLYDWASFGYAPSQQWYADILGGNVLVQNRREVDNYGMTPKRWRSGTPLGAV